MGDFIRKISLFIVSCGTYGKFPLGSIFLSPLAFPFLIGARLFKSMFPMLCWILVAVLLAVIMFSLYLVRKEVMNETVSLWRMGSFLIIDKVLGLMLAFLDVTLFFKLMVIGFFAFHIVRMCVPFLLKRFFAISLYETIGVFSGLVSSFVAGAIVNMFLQLILWAAK